VERQDRSAAGSDDGRCFKDSLVGETERRGWLNDRAEEDEADLGRHASRQTWHHRGPRWAGSNPETFGDRLVEFV
jgi:hypothetical protein